MTCTFVAEPELFLTASMYTVAHRAQLPSLQGHINGRADQTPKVEAP